MNKWYILTLVGSDQSGIVAKVSAALYAGGCQLGETSMMRLGSSFTIMMMVTGVKDEPAINDLLTTVCQSMQLHLHIDEVAGGLHQHHIPDVRVIVFGADRTGIVAQVTKVLFDAGLDILDLESDVGGDQQKPIYIMQIEGCASRGMDALQQAIDGLDEAIEVELHSIDTLIA